MSIKEIYTTYNIMPSLQTHQFRVAGVAKTLCIEHRVGPDSVNIITACLLHDMGNIIKFKLDLFPDFLEPEGLNYWRDIKQKYHEKYGDDEHVGTLEIVKEIFDDGLRLTNQALKKGRVLELIDAIGFSNAQYNYECNDIARKIAAYADMRVEPYGVTTLSHRLEDGHKRFKLHKPGVSNDIFFNEMAEFLEKIEQYLFSDLSISPSDITEEAIQPHITELKHFKL